MHRSQTQTLDLSFFHYLEQQKFNLKSHIQLQAIGPAHVTDIDIFQHKIPCKLKAIAQIDLLLF